jgi:2'-hydroxyisoflavone reductase
MKLLILGGTKFLGRYLAQAALAREHEVTLFNRGQSNPDLFSEVEKLRGDRDGNLRALEGRKWDAVIDVCGYSSGQVRATARLLADSVSHYTFISSISVYRDFTGSGLNESAALEQLPAGAGEEAGNAATYGARKALCEQAADEAMPGRVLNIRPGIIVGPHDTTGRFLYWVRRAGSGSEVLAPGNPDRPVQLIDVRDLADWIVTMVELRKVGIYNATGPDDTLTFRKMLELCGTACSRQVRLIWADEQFLLEKGVKPFADLPFWLPAKSHRGFFEIDCRRAISSGLAFRPLVETARETLARSASAGGDIQYGLDETRERELLELWWTGGGAVGRGK